MDMAGNCWIFWADLSVEQRYRVLFTLLAGTGLRIGEALGLKTSDLTSDCRTLAWYGSGLSEAYDHDIRLLWNFWHNMRNCENGVPYYLQHQVWQQGEDDPRGWGATRSTWRFPRLRGGRLHGWRSASWVPAPGPAIRFAALSLHASLNLS